jgi:putative phage-type endonuclease
VKPGQRVTPAGVLVAPSGIPEDEWLALRMTGIGGSDVASLLGMNRYTSPRELYLEKRGELPEMPRGEFLMRAAKWGHLHEPLIAAEFARQHGVRTRRVGLIRHVDDSWRLANLDRQVHGCPDGPCLLEIKNRSAWKAAEWGPSGDPEGVPDTEALQTHHYLGVTGYGHAHVGVLINGNDDRYYRVERDEELIADVVAMEAAFWKRVQDGDPPAVDGSAAVTELLGALWPATEGAEVVLGPGEAAGLLAKREAIQGDMAALSERLAGVDNELKAMLGDAEIALREGAPVFTWKRNGVFAGKRFKQAHPDLAEKYTHLVPVIDTKALAADHPDIYRANRARVLRITGRTS